MNDRVLSLIGIGIGFLGVGVQLVYPTKPVGWLSMMVGTGVVGYALGHRREPQPPVPMPSHELPPAAVVHIKPPDPEKPVSTPQRRNRDPNEIRELMGDKLAAIFALLATKTDTQARQTFEARYKGAMVVLSGVVANVHELPESAGVSVFLSDRRVQLSFADKQIPYARTLERGEEITVQGTIDSLNGGAVLIRKCRVVQ